MASFFIRVPSKDFMITIKIYPLNHNNDCGRSLNWTICGTAPTSTPSWLPWSFVHKYFPAAHLWPFRSLSLCKFPFVQLTHYGRQGLGEWSTKELVRVFLFIPEDRKLVNYNYSPIFQREANYFILQYVVISYNAYLKILIEIEFCNL